jgi:hypothetical protein
VQSSNELLPYNSLWVPITLSSEIWGSSIDLREEFHVREQKDGEAMQLDQEASATVGRMHNITHYKARGLRTYVVEG